MNRLVIGLTGGIGTGKSTVADLFAQHHAEIIDTDVIARDLTQPHQESFHLIVAHFGPTILLSSGALDRKKLRQIIFQNPSERKWLESILHPRIRAQMNNMINASHAPYCIAVIPLLLETAPNPLIDRILVVDTPEDLQLQRSSQRDNTPISAIQAIINIQISREKRLAAADDVIYNHGDLDDLAKQVAKWHAYYLGLLKYD